MPIQQFPVGTSKDWKATQAFYLQEVVTIPMASLFEITASLNKSYRPAHGDNHIVSESPIHDSSTRYFARYLQIQSFAELSFRGIATGVHLL